MNSLIKLGTTVIVLLITSACTTINVDQVRLKKGVELNDNDAMVVLGRHQTAEIQTEASLVDCIGKKLSSRTKTGRIIPEKQFVDAFYPWFEPRTAPLTPKRLQSVLDQPLISEKMQALNVRYLIWVEGSTETTGGSGSMTCSISPGGGGCFGFSSWEDTSDYETTIWDVQELTEVGRISTEAVGTSYMPAFVIPIPLLARVEGDACQGMANQLVKFFGEEEASLKVR